MESGQFQGCHFLADAGYGASNWLLTPVRFPAAPKEVRYNNRHCSGRVCIERAFGRLKGKWRLLQNKCRLKPGIYLWFLFAKTKTIKYYLEKLSQIIAVCCMLHNIGLEFNLEDDDEWMEEDNSDVEELVEQEGSGLDYQKRFVETFI